MADLRGTMLINVDLNPAKIEVEVLTSRFVLTENRRKRSAALHEMFFSRKKKKKKR